MTMNYPLNLLLPTVKRSNRLSLTKGDFHNRFETGVFSIVE